MGFTFKYSVPSLHLWRLNFQRSPETSNGEPVQVFWLLWMRMNCWSIFCRMASCSSLPFNVWSAGMISVFKSNLKIHFYRLLSVAVSILCRLITELNDAILFIYIVCHYMFYSSMQVYFLTLKIFLMTILQFYSLHVVFMTPILSVYYSLLLGGS